MIHDQKIEENNNLNRSLKCIEMDKKRIRKVWIHWASSCNFSRLTSALRETCPERDDEEKFRIYPFLLQKNRQIQIYDKENDKENMKTERAARNIRYASHVCSIKDEEKISRRRRSEIQVALLSICIAI